MAFLKRIFIVILVLVALVFLLSMFLPASFKMEKSISIEADKDVVFKLVNDLRKWEAWSPWAEKDPLIYNDKNAFSTPSFGEGAIFKWNSEDESVGEGSIIISKSENNKYIENEIDLGMGTSKGYWVFEDEDNDVKVLWGIEVDFGFNPIKKFFGLFMEEYISLDFERGLERLKNEAEKLPKIKRVKVEKITFKKSNWFLSIRDSVDQMQMNNIHGKIYTEINKYMDGNGVESSAGPLVIYHFWSDTLIDIEAGIPVKDSLLKGNHRIKLNKINAEFAVTAIHYGAYDRLPETYFGINEWMRKNKVEVIGPPWEVYLTDPTKESNPEKWQTAIYYPVKE